jgi:hypothetical protein
VQTGRALVEAGLHPATGADGTFACSGDMPLEALVACAGVTLAGVSLSIGVDLQGGGTARAEGELGSNGSVWSSTCKRMRRRSKSRHCAGSPNGIVWCTKRCDRHLRSLSMRMVRKRRSGGMPEMN